MQKDCAGGVWGVVDYGTIKTHPTAYGIEKWKVLKTYFQSRAFWNRKFQEQLVCHFTCICCRNDRVVGCEQSALKFFPKATLHSSFRVLPSASEFVLLVTVLREGTFFNYFCDWKAKITPWERRQEGEYSKGHFTSNTCGSCAHNMSLLPQVYGEPPWHLWIKGIIQIQKNK